MKNPSARYNENVFGREYNLLHTNIKMGPSIFVLTLDYFEENIQELTFALNELCSTHFLNNQKMQEMSEMILLCNLFVKWLKELPHPFFSDSQLKFYQKNPCMVSAQQILEGLPENKRPIFSKFIKILQKVTQVSLFPLDFDSFFGIPFFHSKSLSFFNLLTKQSSYLSFPFSQILSFTDQTPIQEQTIRFLPFQARNISNEPLEIQNLYQSVFESLNSNQLFIKYQEEKPLILSEMQQLKRFIKHLLKDFENNLSRELNRTLSITDKNPLEQIYLLYSNLRALLVHGLETCCE